MPVNLMPPPFDPYSGRMAELDALLAKERWRTARRARCLVCEKPLTGRQRHHCGDRCQREAARRRTAAFLEGLG